MEGISACIVAHNEEASIGDCLASLSWCDEIVVVDSHSQDGTRRIAADAGARVIERDWPGYAAQKQYAVEQASADWILSVDADERVSPALRCEIEELRASGFPSAAGWSVPRLSWYMGRWIRHGTWYPDRVVRLFDRRRAAFRDHPYYKVHERVVVDGPTKELSGDIWHWPYRDFSEQLTKIDRYTTLMAEGLFAAGRATNLVEVMVRPWADFLAFYVLRRGCLDGWQGLFLACMTAHSVRLKYGKLWVLQQRLPESPPAQPDGDGVSSKRVR